MIGYYKQPELTAEVLKDGWFYTGDYGYINEKDQLIISGRKKNVIVLNNGKNVYPEEIEGYIQDIDYVNEVVVSGEKDKDGNEVLEPIYISAPEFQVLDNANHPDAKLGKDNNRQAASLYDMIPAVPQNAKPFGEWNKAKIMVYKGTVVHGQNDENVLEYHLWTKQWTEMLQASKFSEEKWPLAFELLNNCGGENHEGFIGVQDHGDDVWYRNIRVKVLD